MYNKTKRRKALARIRKDGWRRGRKIDEKIYALRGVGERTGQTGVLVYLDDKSSDYEDVAKTLEKARHYANHHGALGYYSIDSAFGLVNLSFDGNCLAMAEPPKELVEMFADEAEVEVIG